MVFVQTRGLSHETRCSTAGRKSGLSDEADDVFPPPGPLRPHAVQDSTYLHDDNSKCTGVILLPTGVLMLHGPNAPSETDPPQDVI